MSLSLLLCCGCLLHVVGAADAAHAPATWEPSCAGPFEFARAPAAQMSREGALAAPLLLVADAVDLAIAPSPRGVLSAEVLA